MTKKGIFIVICSKSNRRKGIKNNLLGAYRKPLNSMCGLAHYVLKKSMGNRLQDFRPNRHQPLSLRTGVISEVGWRAAQLSTAT